MAAAYVDSSAFVKLIVAEPESPALLRVLERWPERASAGIVSVETIRALRRSGNGQHVPLARRMLRSLRIVQVDAPLLDRAGELDPPDLRSLDAIHLAAALELSSDLGVILTYDARLAAAATAFGLAVDAPA